MRVKCESVEALVELKCEYGDCAAIGDYSLELCFSDFLLYKDILELYFASNHFPFSLLTKLCTALEPPPLLPGFHREGEGIVTPLLHPCL